MGGIQSNFTFKVETQFSDDRTTPARAQWIDFKGFSVFGILNQSRKTSEGCKLARQYVDRYEGKKGERTRVESGERKGREREGVRGGTVRVG